MIKHPLLYNFRDRFLLRFLTKEIVKDTISDYISDKDLRILDVYCRTGVASINIAKRFPFSYVVGMEENEQFLHIAKQRKRKNHVNNVEFMSISNLPLQKKIFDVVTMFFALNDLNEILIKNLLLNIKKILKAGQKLIIVDYTEGNSFFMKLLLKFYFSLFFSKHTKNFKTINFYELLKETGFYKININEFGGIKIVYALNNKD